MINENRFIFIFIFFLNPASGRRERFAEVGGRGGAPRGGLRRPLRAPGARSRNRPRGGGGARRVGRFGRRLHGHTHPEGCARRAGVCFFFLYGLDSVENGQNVGCIFCCCCCYFFPEGGNPNLSELPDFCCPRRDGLRAQLYQSICCTKGDVNLV